MFSAELKKGSTEMLILSLLDGRPRHGYEIGKLIEARSGGRLTFALPTLYPTLLRLENRGLIKGRWVEKAGAARALLLPAHAAKAGAPSRSSARPGAPTSRRSTTCWGRAVRDWKAFVRARLRAARPDARARSAHRPGAGGAARGLLSRGACRAARASTTPMPTPAAQIARLGTLARDVWLAERHTRAPRIERLADRVEMATPGTREERGRWWPMFCATRATASVN